MEREMIDSPTRSYEIASTGALYVPCDDGHPISDISII